MSWQHPLYELILTFQNGRLHLRDLDGTLEILDSTRQFRETQSISRHTSRWDQYAASFRKSLDAYLESLAERTSRRPFPASTVCGSCRWKRPSNARSGSVARCIWQASFRLVPARLCVDEVDFTGRLDIRLIGAITGFKVPADGERDPFSERLPLSVMSVMVSVAVFPAMVSPLE